MFGDLSNLLRRGLSPIGLDIGTHAIKAAQLRHTSDGAELVAHAKFDRRTGSEPVVGGMLSGEEAERIVNILERRGFRGRNAVVTTPGGMDSSTQLELPPADSGAPLLQIASGEMARVINAELGSFEMAMWELPSNGRKGKISSVMTAACPTGVLENLMETLGGAGITVTGIDLPCNALCRAAEHAGVRSDRISAVVDLGWNWCRVVALHQGEVVYERRSEESGIGHLVELIQGRLGVGQEIAERVLRQAEEGDDALETESVPATIKPIVFDHFEHISGDIEAALSYAEHRYRGVEEGVIQLVGGGSLVPGMGPALSERLECQVERLMPSAFLSDAGDPGSAGPDLTLAVSLALWEDC